MITTGSKYFFGAAALAFVAACVYGIYSGAHLGVIDSVVGVLTLGYKGKVGDHFGYAVLMSTALAALFMGSLTSIIRDADPAAEAAFVHADTVPEVVAPTHPSFTPIASSLAVGSVVIGLTTQPALVVFGLLLAGVVTVEWAVRAWSDRVTGDPDVNRDIRHRMMNPIEVPFFSIVAIAVFVLALSRLLLIVPKMGAYFIFGGVPALILLIAGIFATRNRIGETALVVVAIIGGLAVLAIGIVGVSVPEQPTKEHHSTEGSLAPLDSGTVLVVGTAAGTGT